jgi:hypothetical protein
MTLPQERSLAVVKVCVAVMALRPYTAGKSKTVRVPREELRQLIGLLKHYPWPIDIDRAAELAPEVFGKFPAPSVDS